MGRNKQALGKEQTFSKETDMAVRRLCAIGVLIPDRLEGGIKYSVTAWELRLQTSPFCGKAQSQGRRHWAPPCGGARGWVRSAFSSGENRQKTSSCKHLSSFSQVLLSLSTGQRSQKHHGLSL